MGRPW